jgi:hypothetical protein
VKALRQVTLAALLSALLVAQAFGTCLLRQSDAVELPIGQFVDATDGVTAETGLTISQADVQLKKCAAGGDCGAIAQKNDSSACAHDALGVYECDFDATDTNTVGTLFIYVNESGALTEKLVCQVLEEAVFDADLAASATGLRNANVTQFGGTNGTFASGRPEANTSHWGGTAVASARPLVDTVQVSGDSNAADALELAFDGTATGARLFGIDRLGTAAAVAAGTITLDSGAAYDDNTLQGATIWGCGSTQGYCQFNTVASNVGSTDVLTLSSNWPVTPSGTVTFYLFGTAAGSGGGGGGDATLANQTEILSRLPDATPGSSGGLPTVDANNRIVGVQVLDEDTTTMDLNATATGAAASVTGAVGSVTGNVGGNVTGSVGSVAAGGITNTSIATDAIGSDEIAATGATEIATAVTDRQGTIVGTCDSGSTTTCVDNALTQADATQLQGRLMCFDDSWCAIITTFTPGSDTATMTKVAPSTRSAKVYTIFPGTVE